MNDVAISWKRVYATYPEQDNLPDTWEWTRKNIVSTYKIPINTK